MTQDSVQPADDPQIGNVSTPINSSDLTKTFLSNLSIYRAGLTARRRGLEIGIAHGYILFGPFASLGPLRDSNISILAGLLASAGLIIILSACLWLYTRVGIEKSIIAVTTPQVPKELMTQSGWNDFTRGFLVGGLEGVLLASFVALVVFLFMSVLS